MVKRAGVLLVILLVLATSVSGCLDDDDKEKDKDPPEVKETKESLPGEMRLDFLRSTNYTRLVIEVDYISTASPSSEALSGVVTFMQEHCDKTTVTYQLSDRLESDSESYSIEDVAALEDSHRDRYPDLANKTMSLYIIYLNGELEDSPNTLGVTYRGSSFAIFLDQIESIGIPNWAELLGLRHTDFESSVAVHEAGHLLGLVNIGYESDRDHEDGDHAHHCRHEECVMYYAIETVAIVNLISQGELEPPTELCQDCAHDLEAMSAG